MWQQIFSIIATLGLAALLTRQLLDTQARRRNAPTAFFGEAARALEAPRITAGVTAGAMNLDGSYRGHPVQVRAITDTLAVRKLPSLWLMVTIPETLAVKACFDLMMRPAGPTTFSNFDHLAETLETPADFPRDAVIRSDNAIQAPPPHVVAPHVNAFVGLRGKELLVSPRGLRMVVLMAEADRARYGVFRQANFGGSVLAAERLEAILTVLLALRNDLTNWHGTKP